MEKKKPLRKCVGCNEMKPKSELVRVIRTAEGEILLDTTGRMNGRGAYICRSVECLEKARKARRFEKSFSCRIEESVYEVMLSELSEGSQDS